MTKYLIFLTILLSVPVFAQGGNEPEAINWTEFFSKAAKELPQIVVESGIPVPVYGNYCGPNHGDGTYATLPIDAVDEACMYHDMCYDPNVGGTYLCCGCDAALVNNLMNALASASQLSYKAIAVGVAITGWFSQSACHCTRKFGNMVYMEEPSLGEKESCKV